MAHDNIIGPLFDNVLQNAIRRYGVNNDDIRTAIQNMKEVYKPNPTGLNSEYVNVVDYNDVAHRCAYLHKNAPFHAALVADMLTKAMKQGNLKRVFQDFFATSREISLCSLGGGPGSDIIGIISVLVSQFGYFQMSATIIDLMLCWKDTFASLVKELRGGVYGQLSDFSQAQYFCWNYIEHDLLGKMSSDVNKAIQGAHVVTMVKFVSGVLCKDTSEMIKKIFRSMKVGAVAVYIDNAGGGFHRTFQRCAQECNLFSIFGPLKHEQYVNVNFNVRRFGYNPNHETKITFHILRKSHGTTPDNDSYYINNSLNQYKIQNTNIFYTNTSNVNVPANHQVPQGHVPNRRGNTRGKHSSRRQRFRSPGNRQQRSIGYTPYNNEEEEEDYENEEDVSCCIIL